ncbi:hypothetical protein AVEN_18733-1 [Araneus ventricosus]|uniref:Uncharacterized protein n=1 Tax=Araneus ventricosus TaxID=182803 RepID=A0A4Y2GMF9_ARAVE|nr:hypothetical protein AVEN_18733-1 [Araneus ventricosus]
MCSYTELLQFTMAPFRRMRMNKPTRDTQSQECNDEERLQDRVSEEEVPARMECRPFRSRCILDDGKTIDHVLGKEEDEEEREDENEDYTQNKKVAWKESPANEQVFFGQVKCVPVENQWAGTFSRYIFRNWARCQGDHFESQTG